MTSSQFDWESKWKAWVDLERRQGCLFSWSFFTYQGCIFVMIIGCRSGTLTLDSKRRFMLPVQFRHGMPSNEDGVTRWYVGHEEDPCLYLHTETQHEAYVNNLKELFGDADEEARDAFRALVGNWAKVSTDGSGRLTLSEEHKATATLDKSVTLVAGADRVEVWNTELYEGRRTESLNKGAYAKLRALRKQRATQTSNSGHLGGPGEDG